LSTPEGPTAPETTEGFKIPEMLLFPTSNEHSHPMLISPKNAELLIPSAVTTSKISSGVTSGKP
jgi:hypothetical protein